ncbi:MAG TPA: Gfo/Idh/MocA family oxidoreductase [Oligoflexia bacterium]|nr:Gfo/Idh/MocA family oxidoreductase [Oligoflexia bacterium]HMP49381.1 Gfo/Idh/MocA family oxidoreductase [Oligoflexia bacterium]
MNAAVIGAGYLGSFHAEKYSKLPQVDLVAVCDLDVQKAGKLSKKLKTESVSDFRLLPDLGVNCATVASDTRTHYEISKFLLDAGIDVLVEKPMTTTINEARELIEIARQNNRILQVGHLERFNPALAKLKEQLHCPWFFEVRRIAPFKGRGADVDVVLDLMIHDIDLLLYLSGRRIIKVEAMGIPVLTGSIDIANARLEFEGGAVANVSASRAAFQSERTIRVFQPDRYISLDLEKKRIKVATRGEGLTLLGFPQIDQQEEYIDERDALQDQVSSFVEAARNRTKPLVSGEDGLRALELVERIKESMRESALRFTEAPTAEVVSALGIQI